MKKIYWLLITATSLEILNLILMIIPEYYGNRVFLLVLVLLISWLGIESKVNKVGVIISGTILAALIVLTLFVVWNGNPFT